MLSCIPGIRPWDDRTLRRQSLSLNASLRSDKATDDLRASIMPYLIAQPLYKLFRICQVFSAAVRRSGNVQRFCAGRKNTACPKTSAGTGTPNHQIRCRASQCFPTAVFSPVAACRHTGIAGAKAAPNKGKIVPKMVLDYRLYLPLKVIKKQR